jgi:hypothetical protein
VSTEAGVTEAEEALAVSAETTNLLHLLFFVSHAAAVVIAGHDLAAAADEPYSTAPGEDYLADIAAYQRAAAAGARRPDA